MSQIQFLTANDLRTGRSVFWSQDNGWSLDRTQAFLATTDDDVQKLSEALAREQNDIEVVGPYIVQAKNGASADVISHELPKKMRESRRLVGPGPTLTEARIAQQAA